MPDDRTLAEFKGDTFTQLSAPVRNVHSRRAVLWKVSADMETRGPVVIVRYITDAATIARERGESLRCEHVVPRSVVLRRLALHVDYQVSMPEVDRAVELFRHICYVTNAERAHLDQNYGGWSAKTHMPSGWDYMTGDLLARYELVQQYEPRMSSWRMA